VKSPAVSSQPRRFFAIGLLSAPWLTGSPGGHLVPEPLPFAGAPLFIAAMAAGLAPGARAVAVRLPVLRRRS